MTIKKPLTNSIENLQIDKEISDDKKFVDAIPLEELKMKISKEKQYPLTENAISSEEDFPNT